jgi:hypothetical protein
VAQFEQAIRDEWQAYERRANYIADSIAAKVQREIDAKSQQFEFYVGARITEYGNVTYEVRLSGGQTGISFAGLPHDLQVGGVVNGQVVPVLNVSLTGLTNAVAVAVPQDSAIVEELNDERETPVYGAVTSGATEIDRDPASSGKGDQDLREISADEATKELATARATLKDYEGIVYRNVICKLANEADCSSYVSEVLNRSGFNIGKLTSAMVLDHPRLVPVSPGDEREGDIMYEPDTDKKTGEVGPSGHIGIYTGQRNRRGLPLGLQMGKSGAKEAVWGPQGPLSPSTQKPINPEMGWFPNGERLRYFRVAVPR